MRHPLKRYLLVPFVLSVGLAFATMFAARRYWSQELASMVSSTPVLGGFFLGIMTVVGGVVLFLIAQPLLLAVFSDQLSERVERDVLGTAHNRPVPDVDGPGAGARPAEARALRHRARRRRSG